VDRDRAVLEQMSVRPHQREGLAIRNPDET
jgi:hypothetical protein